MASKIMKGLGVIFISVCAIVCTLKLSSGTVSDEVFRRYNFPIFKSSRHLCHQHVHGAESEITWDALVTSAQPDKVASFYIEHLGTKAMTGNRGGWTWRFPAGSSQPDRVLSVHLPTADGPWRHCKQTVPPDAAAVIMLSTMTRFRK